MNAQTDLNLRLAHMSKCMFSHVAAHILGPGSVEYTESISQLAIGLKDAD